MDNGEQFTIVDNGGQQTMLDNGQCWTMDNGGWWTLDNSEQGTIAQHVKNGTKWFQLFSNSPKW